MTGILALVALAAAPLVLAIAATAGVLAVLIIISLTLPADFI